MKEISSTQNKVALVKEEYMFETICPSCKQLIRIRDISGKAIICPDCDRKVPIETSDKYIQIGKRKEK